MHNQLAVSTRNYTAVRTAAWPPSNDMRVTVLMASHNRHKYLGEAIDSALGQDYSSTEVLVVDDGSDHSTRHWLKRRVAADHRLSVVFQDHSGVATARARGLDLARGDLVTILDSDDLLAPDAVSRIVDLFRRHPETALVYSHLEQLMPGGEVRRRVYPSFPTNQAMLRATLLSPRVPFKHSGTTFRREEALRMGSYDRDLPCKVDIDLFLKYLSSGKRLRLLEQPPAVTFRVHKQSISSNRKLGIRVWFRLIDRYGPKSYTMRAAIKALRASSETLKAGYMLARVR
ncbi:MAG: glycosyltransferase [Gammaproteobacteria bacterium]